MAINRPDSFQSLGNAIVNGGETQQITTIFGQDGIVVESYQTPFLSRNRGAGDAALAYSLRQLRDGENFCVQMENASGGVLNVGFATNDKGIRAIDEAQVVAFAGGTTSRVRVIYDQSGNDNHLFGAGGNAQFFLTDSNGQLFKINDAPYLKASGNDDQYGFVNSVTISEDYAFHVVSGGDMPLVAFPINGGAFDVNLRTANSIRWDLDGAQSFLFADATTLSDPHIFLINSGDNGEKAFGYQDNVVSTNGSLDVSGFSFPASMTAAGAGGDNVENLTNGFWGEVIVWNNSNQENNRTILYNNTNAFYQIKSPVPDTLVIRQPDLTYKKSTTLSGVVNGGTAGATAEHVILFYDWSSTDMVSQSGLVQYWNGTSEEWLQADSSSFNATLLLGMSAGTRHCVKRGLVRTTRDFSTFSIGQALYLGTGGEVTVAIPTTQNHYERLLGWVMDQDATAGLMFFSPDVNFKTIA